MLDLLSKKKEPLFMLPVKLEHRTEDVITEKIPVLRIKSDGSVYAAIKKVGNIAPALWQYVLQFGTPKELRRYTSESFEMDVYGTIDRSAICENPIGHPYTYLCGVTEVWPYMIPRAEYYCQLIDRDDHFDIVVLGAKIGELEEEEERSRLGKLRSMLSKGFTATAKILPHNDYCDLFVNVRKQN